MANFELILDRDALDYALAVEKESIEWKLNTEISDSDFDAIVKRATSYTNFDLTDIRRGIENGWRSEYELLAEAWFGFCCAVARHAADEVLGE